MKEEGKKEEREGTKTGGKEGGEGGREKRRGKRKLTLQQLQEMYTMAHTRYSKNSAMSSLLLNGSVHYW